jgi:dTDP-glucose 4,6-dehydratase
VNVLVTGGFGFIGSNLIRLLRRERPEWRVVNLDLVTYAANPENLVGIEGGRRYRFVQGDVADRGLVGQLFREEVFDAVLHCAAETHVDRSLEDGGRFLRTNVEGTLVLLEAASESRQVRHVQVGSDEVYGTLGPGEAPFTEDTPLRPRSPYSASKAAADHLVLAMYHSYGLDVVVTRCSNNYGPYQHPEKLIPLMITAAIRRLPLPVYGDGHQRRDWIYVEDHCQGLLAALERGQPGEVYNFGGGADWENLAVVRTIVQLLGASEDLIAFVADRPGHDRRYEVDSAKAERELGWRPRRSFADGLKETVAWYAGNRAWWEGAARDAYTESRRRIDGWAARS